MNLCFSFKLVVMLILVLVENMLFSAIVLFAGCRCICPAGGDGLLPTSTHMPAHLRLISNHCSPCYNIHLSWVSPTIRPGGLGSIFQLWWGGGHPWVHHWPSDQWTTPSTSSTCTCNRPRQTIIHPQWLWSDILTESLFTSSSGPLYRHDEEGRSV